MIEMQRQKAKIRIWPLILCLFFSVGINHVFNLTAFFASKVEQESKSYTGKTFQRAGPSAFERVFTAK